MDKTQEEMVKEMRSFFMKGLSSQGGSFLIASIADLLSVGLSTVEIQALGSFLGAISQTMSYISAQKNLNETDTQS